LPSALTFEAMGKRDVYVLKREWWVFWKLFEPDDDVTVYKGELLN
jgi:hypothetical protein